MLSVLIGTGIITAMLLPAFSAVIQNPQQATCVSNLRHLGIALSQYADDNNGYFPSPGGGLGRAWAYTDPQTGDNLVLGIYLKSQDHSVNDFFVCPNLAGKSLLPQAKGSASYFTNYPRSYGMNHLLRSPGIIAVGGEQYNANDPDDYNDALDPLGYKKLNKLQCGIAKTAIPIPANTVLLYEGIPCRSADQFNGNTYRSGGWSAVGGYYKTANACSDFLGRANETCQTPGLTPWHQGRNNYLYCDGHVKTHAPVQEGWVPSQTDPGDFLVQHCRTSAAPCP